MPPRWFPDESSPERREVEEWVSGPGRTVFTVMALMVLAWVVWSALRAWL